MTLYQLFWSEFGKTSELTGKLLLSGRPREAFEIIDGILTGLQIGFCFDLTVSEGRPCLIFSPEGENEIAEKIDALVAHGPHPDKWIVLGRRPMKMPQDACAIVRNLYLIDPEICKYKIHLGKCNFICIFVPLDSDLSESECVGFANTLLWHAIGESEVMNLGLRHEVKFGTSDQMDLLDFEEMRNQLLRAAHHPSKGESQS